MSLLPRNGRFLLLAALIWYVPQPVAAQESAQLEQLLGAILGDTPLEEDLWFLTDRIGGRPTGSEHNLRSVEWALGRFRDAGVSVAREAFTMPERWVEEGASAMVVSPTSFPARVAAMPFSVGTGPEGMTARVVGAGYGTAEDFAGLGEDARDAFVLIQTDFLEDVAGLFAEYQVAPDIERQAIALGAQGVIFMGSRPGNHLYRHILQIPDRSHPVVIMEREAAQRILRLLAHGEEVTLNLRLDIEAGGEYQSYNVIGEIPGSSLPEEIVLVGAHLDSWGLGTGALDNGGNVAMLIDIARQMEKLGIQPRRTVRFALFNGEEQRLVGSWRYTQQHAEELDRHVMAASFDLGTGRITGFFTGGRPEMVEAVDRALEPVSGLGPFQHFDVPIVGTDNYDFMMQGVGNLVAAQESANYGPHYHARSDTFDKADLEQLRLNEAIAAAVILGFANMEVTWERQTRAEIEALIAATDLRSQMEMFGLWEPWERGERGRRE